MGTKNIEEEKNTSADELFLESLYDLLRSEIPDDLEVDVEEPKSALEKVNEHNKDIINTYLQGEIQHLQQQKAVAIIVSCIVGIQLIAFNVLIYFVVLDNFDFQTRTLLLEFMKYYVGAVILEMLGMCLIIIRSIYTMSIGKMAEHIIKGKK